MRILELGSYVVPAYCGMILAEQGHEVTKWIHGRDPILDLKQGDELWAWINHGKTIETRHASDVNSLPVGRFDIVVDNFRPSTLERFSIDPARIAADLDLVWVSMRSDVGEVSFDAIAQARGWLDTTPYLPFYAGDTIGGLWLAFKALAARESGHRTITQAASLAKLIEGEMTIDVTRTLDRVPWDLSTYEVKDGIARVEHRGVVYEEPIRDRAWKQRNLRNENGRFII